MEESRESGPEMQESIDPFLECYCRLDGVIDLLSRRYTIPLICLVGAIGPARHGEIADILGEVSSSTLSTRFEELVEAGYLDRQQYNEIPPRVEYDLTPAGAELCERLQPLLEWADGHDAD